MIDEILKMQIDAFNSQQGDLNTEDGIECKKCKNRGCIAYELEGYMMTKDCSCMSKRRTIRMAIRSGIYEVIKAETFDTYKATEKWQQLILAKAKEFVENKKAKGFAVTGQIGAGKTHICVAVLGALIKKGLPARYVIWNDVVTELKQTVYEDKERYERLMNDLIYTPVLYIDDFFREEQTKADIDKAFMIINNRYNLAINSNKRYVTIISSQRTMDNLLNVDEAISSRLMQLCSEYLINIENDFKKNYRVEHSKGVNI